MISSRARYDRFDTSPFRKYSVFGTDNMISSAARYDHFDTTPNMKLFYMSALTNLAKIKFKANTRAKQAKVS